MKKFTTFLTVLCVSLAGAACLAIAQGINRTYFINASDYGPRHSMTLNRLIAAVGSSKQVAVVIDNGTWTITNNVNFGTNFTVIVPNGSKFAVATNYVMGFTGGFEAGDYDIFSGWGSATGSANFIYRWPTWGDTQRWDIGDGVLGSYYSSLDITTWISNNMARLMTNTYPYLDTDVRNDWTTNNFYPAYSYIHGMWPVWNTPTNFSIGFGEGYVGTNFFSLQSTLTHGPANFAQCSAYDVLYIYIDDSLTTYPTNIVLLDQTNIPTRNTVYDQFMFGDDRCIAALYVTNSTLQPFTLLNGGYVMATNIPLATSMNPDGTWQTPDTLLSETILPANVKRAKFAVSAADSGAECIVAIATYEASLRGTAAGGVPELGSAAYFRGYNTLSATPWIWMGSGRAIRILGQNDDDNNLDCSLMGWEIDR